MSLSYGCRDKNSYLLNWTVEQQFTDTFETKVTDFLYVFLLLLDSSYFTMMPDMLLSYFLVILELP